MNRTDVGTLRSGVDVVRRPTPARRAINRIAAIAVAVAGVVCIDGAAAHPFDLDPSFGTGGVVRLGTAQPAPFPFQSAAGPLFVQPDRRIVVVVNGQAEPIGIMRLGEDGSPDPAFANGARLGTSFFANDVRGQADGKIVASGGTGWTVLRLLTDGTPDPGFGTLGGAVNSLAPIGVGVQGDGRILVGGAVFDNLAVARFLPNGQPDLAFGPGGIRTAPVLGVPAAFLLLPNGSSLLAAYSDSSQTDLILVKFRPDGTLDPVFASDGVYRDNSSSALLPRSMAVQADGRVIVVGRVIKDGVPQLAAMRVDAFGNVDPAFGPSGRVMLPPGMDSSEGRAVALDSRQRIVIAGTVGDLSESSGGFRRIVVLRVNPDGMPDGSFAPNGMTLLWDGYSSTARSVAVDPADRIVVGGTREAAPIFVGGNLLFDVYRRQSLATLFRLQGGDGTVLFSVALGNAIEYINTLFGHYFITADPLEIAHLDAFSGAAWTRTGKSFRVWTEAATNLSRMCRFFSGQSFAPKSSHFYTPYSAECDAVQAGRVWTYEGDAFFVQLPQGIPGSRTCPPGTHPLYRAFNNGQGGAPNHRYTDDPAVLDQMIAQGWTFEGEINTRVFACIPL